MATTTQERKPRAPADPVVNRFVFEEVSWDDYEAMLRIIGNRPIRVNYDQGRLEIMSPSYEHENSGYLLGRMVDTLTEELEIPIDGGDMTTLRRQDLKRGVEPDKCYFLYGNAARVQGKRELIMGQDPPPDLVIEVDITSSSVPRLPIFAALGIPEVWRFAGKGLEFLHLQDDGIYRAESHSRAFPWLAAAEIARFLEAGRNMEKTPWIRQFRAFVRDEVAPRLPQAEPRPEGPAPP